MQHARAVALTFPANDFEGLPMLAMACGYLLAVTLILALFRASGRADARLEEMFDAAPARAVTPHGVRSVARLEQEEGDVPHPAVDRPEALGAA